MGSALCTRTKKALDWYKKRYSSGWYLDETYIKVKGEWTYLYRAIDENSNTIDFYLSPRRNAKSASSIGVDIEKFEIEINGKLDGIVINQRFENLDLFPEFLKKNLIISGTALEVKSEPLRFNYFLFKSFFKCAHG